MSATIEYRELSKRWAEVLKTVRSGEEVVIVDESIPQARLLPIVGRKGGLHPGAMVMHPDFDEALPDVFWQGEP